MSSEMSSEMGSEISREIRNSDLVVVLVGEVDHVISNINCC